MTNNEIVAKLWNLCNVLRDDGITYQDYVTELTYILFLKMAKETGAEKNIPEEYRWDKLCSKDGIELKKFYATLLQELGENGGGKIQHIYSGAGSKIDEPANLKKIITSIDDLDWYSAKEEGLGNLYEGLLEKNANEKKSGAGQYFTPRVLIDVMTELTAPQPGEKCNDPACGTYGFMIAADRYVKEHTNELFDLSEEEQHFQKYEAFTGAELVHETHRLALMNSMLHDIEGEIYLCDTLSNQGKALKNYDVVLTNPPFGTKKGGERAGRDDLTYMTSNKQLNFLQHIYRSLNTDGKARAAVVLPDNVLFADNDGEKIRKDLMEKCNLHTILRLPTGIFYAQGVKTNVLFFHRGTKDKGNTKTVWIYDLRSNMPSFGKTNPLTRTHFDEFVECYCAGHMEERKETWSNENPNGRWRKFDYEKDILTRDKTSLDITWIRSENDADERTLAELLAEIEEKASNINSAIAALKSLIGDLEE
ncbi:MAG: type I restriction-modification system subunit M [Butyrivibrio sp.]|nr:type I restriction-modification system subunit M [Butyrivibrio sp.]